MRKIVLSSLLALLSSPIVNAADQRWFEIEMIVFSRTSAAQQLEQFDHQVRPIKLGRSFDLLTPMLQQDIRALLTELPDCQPEQDYLAAPEEYRFRPFFISSLCISEPQLPAWQYRNLFEERHYVTHQPFPAQLPVTITGNGPHRSQPYLADNSALQLTAEARQIQRQRGHSLLLHTAWRQAPVTERRAIPSRWYAGRNYSTDFDYWAQPRHQIQTDSVNHETPVLPVHSEGILTDIDQLLNQLKAGGQLPPLPESKDEQTTHSQPASGNVPEQVWQLDGLFKLHLDHYLFVNTEFNLRRLNSQNQLESIYSKQSRRVISGELHYLDHPYLGIILQIRRYDPAQED